MRRFGKILFEGARRFLRLDNLFMNSWVVLLCFGLRDLCRSCRLHLCDVGFRIFNELSDSG